jgi:hypothetical protein
MSRDKSILEKFTDKVKEMASSASEALKAEEPPKVEQGNAAYMPFAAEGLVSDPLLIPPVAPQPRRRTRTAKTARKSSARKAAKRSAPRKARKAAKTSARGRSKATSRSAAKASGKRTTIATTRRKTAKRSARERSRR